mmetsp:Transcript_16362/g.26892  ORF Transcript_16362/g.26892 Transcript_16362/m.26892 type:complete len:153 (+) Transcript_16362:82-540(+)
MTIVIYLLASSVLLVFCCATAIAFSSAPAIVPEVHPAHVTKGNNTTCVKAALGDEDGANDNRYAFARDAVTSFQENDESPPSNELVYGELRVEVLSRRILDAAGVQRNDTQPWTHTLLHTIMYYVVSVQVCGVISTQMILNDRLSKKKDIFE